MFYFFYLLSFLFSFISGLLELFFVNLHGSIFLLWFVFIFILPICILILVLILILTAGTLHLLLLFFRNIERNWKSYELTVLLDKILKLLLINVVSRILTQVKRDF